MAATDKVVSVPGSDLTAMERMWIVQALKTQFAVLQRSRNKENAGSEIWALRGRELEAINALIVRFNT